VVSMMDILSGAVPLMGDVRQSGSGPDFMRIPRVRDPPVDQ
jgi:hypothetical protein